MRALAGAMATETDDDRWERLIREVVVAIERSASTHTALTSALDRVAARLEKLEIAAHRSVAVAGAKSKVWERAIAIAADPKLLYPVIAVLLGTHGCPAVPALPPLGGVVPLAPMVEVP